MKPFFLLLLSLILPVSAFAESKSPRKDENSFKAAVCNGSVAKTEWILAAANPPTPACVRGKNVINGVLNFDAETDQSAIIPLTLPPQFTGNVNVKIMWQAADTIGSVGWCVELIPSANLKREGGVPLSQTAGNCASDQAKKSPQLLEKPLVINVAATAPAANGDVLHIRLSRDANSSAVLDDMPGDARLMGVVIETQAASAQPL